MVFYTGDPHGDVAEIVKFCRQMRLQPADTLVILGDVGAHYYLNKRDIYVQEQLDGLPMCPATGCRIGAAVRCMPNRSIPMFCSPWTARSTRWKDEIIL